MLNRLKSLHKPINISIVGIGAMGKGLLYQAVKTPNITCLAIADINIQRCIEAADWLNLPYKVVENKRDMEDTINAGFLAITDDGLLPATCDDVDVFIEATNAIIPAAEFSVAAIEHGKHLYLMNAEIDLIFGPRLMQLARLNNVTYASCDGDQHGVLKHLIDEIQLWDFELIMAGNVKGYLDRYSNPTAIIPEADKRNLDYKMATAYTDGTKLCIEMAILANAYNLRTAVTGMHGPRAKHVHDSLDLFDLHALRALDYPVVDYVLGSEPNGGVFVIGYCDDPYQMSMMNYYKMGTGPFYVFYRPYHLCHVEAMAWVGKAVLDNESLLEPTYGLCTNVYAYAKQDLKAGQTLDGIGGYKAYGLIENCPTDIADIGLPICIAEDVVLKNDIPKDQKLTLNDIYYDPKRLDFDLYLQSQAIVFNNVPQWDLVSGD